ncbi:hypothetical protein KEJ49_07985, partial [Candidatus Bathyarchaeota archaeon]|nr:hypothetical protein [Candidatus Bathyarchaeota archaeon]
VKKRGSIGDLGLQQLVEAKLGRKLDRDEFLRMLRDLARRKLIRYKNGVVGAATDGSGKAP